MKNVTDGKIVFENYYWNDKKEIVSKISGKELKGDKSLGYRNYTLYQKDGKYKRQYNVLFRASFPELCEPEDKENYIDVFGLQDKYCFRKDNPNIIWSKIRRDFIHPTKHKYGHLIIAPKLQNRKHATCIYVHVMVWESYNKMKYDGNKINIHHIDRNKQNNRIQNLVAMNASTHHIFHNDYKYYVQGKLDLENFKFLINNYVGASMQIKQMLILSLK